MKRVSGIFGDPLLYSVRAGRAIKMSHSLVARARIPRRVCTENLNPDVVVMKSAKDRV